MSKALRGLLVGASVCVALASMGCEGNQEKIAMLEENNQRLLDDCNACRDEVTALRDERDRYHDQYLAAKAQVEALQGELAEIPEVPEGWQAVPGGAMVAVEGSVLFREGYADLREQAKPTVARIVTTVRETYPDKQVVVYGHTCSKPIRKSKLRWKDNFELSAQRALAVVRELEKSGIDPTRLVAAGCGEHRPVEPNTTDDGMKKNRRVEIYVLDAKVKTASR